MNLKEQLEQTLNDLSKISTETVLLLGALALLIIGLLTKNSLASKACFGLIICVALWSSFFFESKGLIFHKSLILNDLNRLFTPLLIVSAGFMLLFDRKKHTAEFYFLVLALLVGSLFMIKANSLLVTYLSMELVSYVAYTLTVFSFSTKGNESAIKYLLFGAVSSAIFLMGAGMVYGYAETIFISDLKMTDLSAPFLQVGLALMFFGVFFKISVFPLHIWTPAIYQSAPVDAVVLFSILPKLAGMVLLSNMLSFLALPISHPLLSIIILAGIVTVVVGTFGALRQSNTRRMIAFGSIAHSGFLLGFLFAGELPKSLFLFYAIIYSIMNVGIFYLISLFEAKSVLKTKDYAETQTHPLIMVAFTGLLISMVGIPPLAGFTAKFTLFTFLWSTYLENASSMVLSYLLVTVFATVVALFYYLRIPYYYFLHSEKVKMRANRIEFSVIGMIVATLFCVTMILLFFKPSLIIR